MPVSEPVVPTPSFVLAIPALEAELLPSGLLKFLRLFQREYPQEDFSHLVGGEGRPIENVINVFKVKGHASL